MNNHDEAKHAHELLSAQGLAESLKADFPNAKLGLKPVLAHTQQPVTSRERIDKTMVELQALVKDLTTLIATLAAIRDRL
jgi:hypothetical protein